MYPPNEHAHIIIRQLWIIWCLLCLSQKLFVVEKRCTGFKRTFTSMIRYTLHYLMNMYYAHVTVKVFLNLECLGFFQHFFFNLIFCSLTLCINIAIFMALLFIHIHVVVNTLMKNIWISLKHHTSRVQRLSVTKTWITIIIKCQQTNCFWPLHPKHQIIHTFTLACKMHSAERFFKTF